MKVVSLTAKKTHCESERRVSSLLGQVGLVFSREQSKEGKCNFHFLSLSVFFSGAHLRSCANSATFVSLL